jgi:DNA-binding PadR family transcriptional regulator
MPAKPEKKAPSRAMTSPVYWVLLGLVIERPSYGLEYYHRYQRVYGVVHPISGESHIYTALDVLKARGLIAAIPGGGTDRQPKPEYQATQSGVRSYEEWLVKQVDIELRRQELWVRQLAVFAHDPKVALRVLGRFERQYLKGLGRVGDRRAWAVAGTRDEVIDELVAEQQRIAVGGMLSFLRGTLARFEARVGGVARDEPPRT